MGFSEFYAYTQFRESETIIGSPSERYRQLHWQTVIPVETLLTLNRSSAYLREEGNNQMFYAESWPLVHYMIFSPNMDGGKKLDDFFARLQKGEDQKKAFEDVFGSFKDMDKALDQYARLYRLRAGAMKNLPVPDEKTYSSRTLTMAETQAEIAGYHLWMKDLDKARPYVVDSLRNDPKLGLAHEDKGFVDFADGKNQERLREFTEAVELDKSLYLSQFAKTMLSPFATSDAPADQEAYKASLNAVLGIHWQFGPAYVQLARLSVRQNDLKMALAYSRKAEELEPFRAGYHVQTGQILLRMGKQSEAAHYAKFVADRWQATDHSEAVELYNGIPEAQRPELDPVTETTPSDTREVQGRMESVTCGKDSEWAFRLRQEGQTLTFHRKGTLRFGYSDTLWFGGDHMTLCHHLEGMRSIVHYWPAADSTVAGDAVEIEIRDDFPAAAVTAGATVGPGENSHR